MENRLKRQFLAFLLVIFLAAPAPGAVFRQEKDPQVGDTTNGNYCIGDGSAVQCNVSSLPDSAMAQTYCRQDGTNCPADSDTTYSASGTLLDLTGTTFSVNEGTLTNGKLCTFVTGVGIVCTSDPGAAAAGGNSGNVQFNSGGTLGGSDNLMWDGTNLGIGTSTPASLLQIGAGTPASIDGTNDLYVVGDIEVDGVIYGDGSQLTGVGGSGDVTGVGDCTGGDCFDGTSDGGTAITLYDSGGNSLIDAGGASYLMGGNVGIGSTSPDAKLVVNGKLKVGDQIYGNECSIIIAPSDSVPGASNADYVLTGTDDQDQINAAQDWLAANAPGGATTGGADGKGLVCIKPGTVHASASIWIHPGISFDLGSGYTAVEVKAEAGFTGGALFDFDEDQLAEDPYTSTDLSGTISTTGSSTTINTTADLTSTLVVGDLIATSSIGANVRKITALDSSTLTVDIAVDLSTGGPYSPYTDKVFAGWQLYGGYLNLNGLNIWGVRNKSNNIAVWDGYVSSQIFSSGATGGGIRLYDPWGWGIMGRNMHVEECAGYPVYVTAGNKKTDGLFIGNGAKFVQNAKGIYLDGLVGPQLYNFESMTTSGSGEYAVNIVDTAGAIVDGMHSYGSDYGITVNAGSTSTRILNSTFAGVANAEIDDNQTGKSYRKGNRGDDSDTNTDYVINAVDFNSTVTGIRIADNDYAFVSNTAPSAGFYFDAVNSALTVRDGSANSKIFLKLDGTVGIGTTTAPEVPLHVKLGDSGGSPNSVALETLEHDTANIGLQFLGTDTSTDYVLFGDASSNAVGRIQYTHSTDELSLWTDDTQQVTVTSTGNVGIGTITPLASLQVGAGIPGSIDGTNDVYILDDLEVAGRIIAANYANVGLGTTNVLTIPVQTAPTVAGAGDLAIDTTDDQLVYYGSAKRVVPYKNARCFVIPDTAAADDNVPIGSFVDGVTITAVWCTCSGTCSTAATFTLEDGAGNAMTITGTNPTCTAIGTVPDAAAVTAGNALTARESLRFDVTNTPSPETDTYELCVSYTTDAQ